MAIVRLTARVACDAMFLAPRASRWTAPATRIRARPSSVAPSPVAVGRFHHHHHPVTVVTASTRVVPDHRRRIAPLTAASRPLHSFAALCAASSGDADRGGGDTPTDEDDVSMDDDEEYEDDEDDDWDPANVPFLVGAGGDGVPAAEVDVLIVEEGGVVDTGDVDLPIEQLADTLRSDAETLVRLLLDPPHNSCLPRGALSGGNEDGASPPDVSYCELSVALCTDAHIKGLNKEWRDKDAATDVLSFQADSFGDVAVLGDCVISIDTARTQANELGHGILDECRVLLVHGLLHLCGYDHELGET